MNSLEELKDYLIADEIQRIESLTREELVRELMDVKSKDIEALSDKEVLNKARK